MIGNHNTSNKGKKPPSSYTNESCNLPRSPCSISSSMICCPQSTAFIILFSPCTVFCASPFSTASLLSSRAQYPRSPVLWLQHASQPYRPLPSQRNLVPQQPSSSHGHPIHLRAFLPAITSLCNALLPTPISTCPGIELYLPPRIQIPPPSLPSFLPCPAGNDFCLL